MYISVPESMNHEIGNFTLDPSILLPVEMPADQENWNIGELQWEQIISGCLKVIAFDLENDHIDYYRNFVLAAKPDIVVELSKTGVLKAQTKDFDLAEEIFLSLCKLVPEEQSSFLNLALLYEERSAIQASLGNNENAELYVNHTEDIYKHLATQANPLPAVFLNYGYFLLHRNNIPDALDQLEAYVLAAPENDPKVSEVKQLMDKLDQQTSLDDKFKEAYTLISSGKEDKGIDKINQFLEHNPSIWNAWFLLGWAYRRKGQFQAGADAFKRAIQEGSTSTDTLNELSICLIELKEYKQAGAFLSQAFRQEPENIKIISNLGILALKEGKPDDALAFFQNVLEIAPDDPIAKQYIEGLK